MKLEERLDRLEEAHRALAAQHTALQLTCRMMLPLIAADPQTVRVRLLAAHGTNNDMMEQHRFDPEYQQDVRHWLDVLSGEILAAADTPQGRRS